MVKLTIYAHPVSQPSRALLWLAALLQVPHEKVIVQPGVDTGKPEFLDKFAFGAVPALEIDDGAGKKTYLEDYTAIAQYLCDVHGGEAGKLFFPTDPIARAKVTGLSIHGQISFRTITYEIFRPLIVAFRTKQPCTLTKEALAKFLSPDLEGKVVDLSRAVGWTKAAHDGTPDPVVEAPENEFLVGKHATIADLINYAEIVQVEMLGLLDEIFARRPAFARWAAKMRALPGYDAVHAPTKGLIESELKKLLPQ
jgi:glutathione S-transferase